MSKTTIRKRIAITAVSAMFAGILTVASAPVANSAVLHPGIVGTGATNPVLGSQSGNTTLYVATVLNTGGSAVAGFTTTETTLDNTENVARSSGLLSKDASTGTAQTATMLAGGTLSLYAGVATTVAFNVSAGTLSGATSQASTLSTGVTYADPARTALMSFPAGQDTTNLSPTVILWTAPTTVGTYTVSMYYASNTSVPTLASPGDGVLGGNITVTVVAASSGGSFSAAYSSCVTKDAITAISQTAANADSTTAQMPNGSPWYIGFILRDAYAAYLADGNIVVTTTTGANVSVDEDGDGNALSSGTGTTVVQYGNGNAGQVKITQATAGAPVTATVTISYNGTTVCTKTVKITGAAASVEISDVATVDLGGNDAPAGWLDEGSLVTGGQRSGHYRVLLKDSAGNIVNPTLAADTFSMDPATTTTTVTALTVNSNYATSTSSSSGARFSVGTFTCGPVAGSSAVKLRHTTAATGVTISSPAFTARCADDPYTYTASWDKASYTAGEIATLTVKFLDSKGNAANSVDTPGPVTMVTPFMTAVSSTGSASMLPTAAGTKAYTFTVGAGDGSLTAGSYVTIIDFTNLTAVAAEKQTPSYKLSTGGDSTTNADVLKSIVALIASINKQIQALQKLILRR